MEQNLNLELALLIAEAGVAVVPIDDDTKFEPCNCGSPDCETTHTAILTASVALRSPREITDRWKEKPPTSLGILIPVDNEERLVCIDNDDQIDQIINYYKGLFRLAKQKALVDHCLDNIEPLTLDQLETPPPSKLH